MSADRPPAPVDAAPRPDPARGTTRRRPLRRRRWWLITVGLLRAVATTTLLVVLYYTLPLDRPSQAHLLLALLVGIVLLPVSVAWEVRAILRATRPGIRAVHALAMEIPFFLLLFASTYVILDGQDPASFGEPLTRTDALYFTVTVFSSVGFGDIAPQSQVARLVVTVQMLLDLVVLGLVVRVIVGAARRARRSGLSDAAAAPTAPTEA